MVSCFLPIWNRVAVEEESEENSIGIVNPSKVKNGATHLTNMKIEPESLFKILKGHGGAVSVHRPRRLGYSKLH